MNRIRFSADTKALSAILTNAYLFVLLAVVSCTGDDSNRSLPDAVEANSWDSAGVRVVESSAEALETTLPWVVDTLPNLELGRVGDGGPSEFTEITGIMGLPGGGLVVLDGGTGELRWFESSGEHWLTVGGRGQGPGEFGDPLLVPQFRSDSLLVFDRARRGFVRVAVDGSGMRRLERPGAGEDGGRLLVGTPRAATGSRALFVSASRTASCRVNEPCEVPGLLRWVGLDTAGSGIVAVYVQRMLNYSDDEGRRFLLHGPLDQKGLVAAAPDGFVIEGNPRFELKQFNSKGRLDAVIRVDAPVRGPAPEVAIEGYAQRSSDPREMRRIFDLMELPEVLPAFQALLVDRLGWYWAELYDSDEAGPSSWLVFDPTGRARGLVRLPGGLDVWVIGEDYVLGRWTDELGVEYVRRHPLDREGFPRMDGRPLAP